MTSRIIEFVLTALGAKSEHGLECKALICALLIKSAHSDSALTASYYEQTKWHARHSKFHSDNKEAPLPRSVTLQLVATIHSSKTEQQSKSTPYSPTTALSAHASITDYLQYEDRTNYGKRAKQQPSKMTPTSEIEAR
eukprot:IDg13723t1